MSAQDEEPLEEGEIVRHGLGQDPVSDADPAIGLGKLEVVELVRGNVDARQVADPDRHVLEPLQPGAGVDDVASVNFALGRDVGVSVHEHRD